MRTLLALLLLSITISTAGAEWPADAYRYSAYKRDAYWSQFYCGGKYRAEGCDEWRWRRSVARRYAASQANSSSGATCKPWTRVVGWQANTRSGAKEYGERMWFFAVQNDFGGQYANLDHAKDYKLNCNPSAITQALKRVLWTCVVSATPCRATKSDTPMQGKRFERDDVEVRD